jgi:sec-independent protein translocase protein TatA
MGPSWWQILVVLVLFVLLFGRGKISDLMGDVAKGIKSFKAGMADDDEARPEPPEPPEPRVIEHETPPPKPKPKPRAKTASRAKTPRKQKSS